MKKSAVVLMLAVVFTMTLTGCSKDKGNQETTAGQVDLSSNSEVAINAGGIGVLTDEVRYYAYTAQATYEAYYISENKNIDWKSDMKKGVSWQEGIKSIVWTIFAAGNIFAFSGQKNTMSSFLTVTRTM